MNEILGKTIMMQEIFIDVKENKINESGTNNKWRPMHISTSFVTLRYVYNRTSI
jgi:hypothetical protein